MMMKWHFVTSQEYHNGVRIPEHIYFLKDTHEIYRGDYPFTEAVILCNEFPNSSIAVNRIYINSNTLEGRVYNGSEWSTVIKPIANIVTEDGEESVTSKAIVEYVTSELSKTNSKFISSAEWNANDHLLTITKGDDSTEEIIFNGLGINLFYDASTGELQLLDVEGNKIGESIKLDLERFVTSGEYDTESKSIILYFDSEKESSISIPVGELIDLYTAEGDGAISLEVTEEKVIKGSIKISTKEGNNISIDDEGLYVNIDVSEKMNKVSDAVENNIAIFDAEGQVIDSGKSFNDIACNNKVYSGSTLEEAIDGITPVNGDVAIISEKIGSSDKVQNTVYQYDNYEWKRLNEQYNAENVIIPEDLITTVEIGVIKELNNGQAVIATAGSSISQVLSNILMKEENPTIIEPSVSFTSATSKLFKKYEVGTAVELNNISAELNAGSYSFGSLDTEGNKNTDTSTGISASNWTFTDSNGISKSNTVNKANFDAITVSDDISYSITASAEYMDSPYTPITNIGNAYEEGKILSNSKSSTTGNITGYRNCFYGTIDNKNELTSDVIRSLTKTNKSVKEGTTLSVKIPVGALRVIVAYVADITEKEELGSVIDVNGMNAQINTGFNLTYVDVAGANNYEPKSYKVFYLDYANANDKENTYDVIL